MVARRAGTSARVPSLVDGPVLAAYVPDALGSQWVLAAVWPRSSGRHVQRPPSALPGLAQQPGEVPVTPVPPGSPASQGTPGRLTLAGEGETLLIRRFAGVADVPEFLGLEEAGGFELGDGAPFPGRLGHGARRELIGPASRPGRGRSASRRGPLAALAALAAAGLLLLWVGIADPLPDGGDGPEGAARFGDGAASERP